MTTRASRHQIVQVEISGEEIQSIDKDSELCIWVSVTRAELERTEWLDK